MSLGRLVQLCKCSLHLVAEPWTMSHLCRRFKFHKYLGPPSYIKLLHSIIQIWHFYAFFWMPPTVCRMKTTHHALYPITIHLRISNMEFSWEFFHCVQLICSNVNHYMVQQVKWRPLSEQPPPWKCLNLHLCISFFKGVTSTTQVKWCDRRMIML